MTLPGATASPAWTLAKHGDSVERKWSTSISARFPLYETFWVRHVVPLTYRVSDPNCMYLRSLVRKELEALATTNYGVFVHLVGCHQQLQTDPELFAREGVYVFYSRLYSVGESVDNFLAAVRVVVREYDGVSFGGKQRDQRLDTNGAAGLSARFKEAFETRTTDYRGQQVHDWGFPVVERQIPRRQFLPRWLDKGLGELDRFLKEPDAEARIAAEFVDAIQQASEDLDFVERVVNEVWDMALRELDDLKAKDRYLNDQAAGGDQPPPTRPSASSSLVLHFR